QFGVVAKDTRLIKRQPPRRLQISLNARPDGNHVVQLYQLGGIRPRRCHRVREGMAQPGDELEKRKLYVSRRTIHEEAALGRRFKNTVEVAEKLRQPLLQKVVRAPPCLLFLLFVTEPRSDRMMGVVDLLEEVL